MAIPAELLNQKVLLGDVPLRGNNARIGLGQMAHLNLSIHLNAPFRHYQTWRMLEVPKRCERRSASTLKSPVCRSACRQSFGKGGPGTLEIVPRPQRGRSGG